MLDLVLDLDLVVEKPRQKRGRESFLRSTPRAVPEKDSRPLFCRGLGDALIQCFAQGILPSEHGDLAWAKPGEPVDLTTYRGFPRQKIASS